jgi:hypothetical protein
MRRRSKTARLGGRSSGSRGPIGCGAGAGLGRLAGWLLWMGQGLQQDLRERVLGMLTLHTLCRSFPSTSSYDGFYGHTPPSTSAKQVNPTVFFLVGLNNLRVHDPFATPLQLAAAMPVHVPVTKWTEVAVPAMHSCDSDACQTEHSSWHRSTKIIASPDAAESVSHILTHFVDQGKGKARIF